MTLDEFNLSDKVAIGKFAPTNDRQYKYYKEEDVKEFIRLIRNKICMTNSENEILDRLAGEKLI